MNREELRAAFRRDAADRTAPYLWPDDDVDAWLDEAEEEACLRKRLLRRDEAYTLAAGDRVVTIDPRMFEVRSAAIAGADGRRYPVEVKDEQELDRIRPDWRTDTGRPEYLIWRGDGTLDLSREADATYALYVEAYCTPAGMSTDASSPEIQPVHHRRLIDWVLFRAYSVPDSDGKNPDKAADHEARFDRYFGRRPTSDLRKHQAANTPHHNKSWW